MKASTVDLRTVSQACEGNVFPVAAYVTEHEAALWHAARLLGGYEQARLVDRLADALRQDPRPSARVRIMLDPLLDLLTLQNAHDPDRAEWGFFVLLDPADPAVEEICILADSLGAAMDRDGSDGRDSAAWGCKAA